MLVPPICPFLSPYYSPTFCYNFHFVSLSLCLFCPLFWKVATIDYKIHPEHCSGDFINTAIPSWRTAFLWNKTILGQNGPILAEEVIEQIFRKETSDNEEEKSNKEEEDFPPTDGSRATDLSRAGIDHELIVFSAITEGTGPYGEKNQFETGLGLGQVETTIIDAARPWSRDVLLDDGLNFFVGHLTGLHKGAGVEFRDIATKIVGRKGNEMLQVPPVLRIENVPVFEMEIGRNNDIFQPFVSSNEKCNKIGNESAA